MIWFLQNNSEEGKGSSKYHKQEKSMVVITCMHKIITNTELLKLMKQIFGFQKMFY